MRNIKDDQIATLINRLYFSGRNVIKKNNIELIESNAIDEITKIIMPDSIKTTIYNTHLGTVHLVEY